MFHIHANINAITGANIDIHIMMMNIGSNLAPLPSPPTAITTTAGSRAATYPTLSPVLCCC